MPANVRIEWVTVDDGMIIIQDVVASQLLTNITTHVKSNTRPVNAEVVLVKVLAGAIYCKAALNADADVTSETGIYIDTTLAMQAIRVTGDQQIFLIEAT